MKHWKAMAWSCHRFYTEHRDEAERRGLTYEVPATTPEQRDEIEREVREYVVRNQESTKHT
jgi:hypothetical protein